MRNACSNIIIVRYKYVYGETNMLIEEAKWFGQKISGIDSDNIFPMCDIGSSTDDFKKKNQPWIDEYIFKSIKVNGLPIKHLDIKKAPGVDIVGDLSDRRFLEELSKMQFKSVFCSNLLEHVRNKEEICRVLPSIIHSGGYIFVSCPFKYPFHAVPIDTMFRPNVHELASLFPNTHIVYGDTVTCGTYLDYITRSPLIFMRAIIQTSFPFYRPMPMGWFTALSHVPWLYRNFQATCVVLRKDSEQ